MNTWQIAKQLRYLVGTRSWTGSTTRVFDPASVIVGTGQELAAAQESVILPLCFIRVEGNQSDPLHGEEPDLVHQQFTLSLVQVTHGDRIGEGVILGANRFGSTDSRGRGVLELEEEVFAAVELLVVNSGVVILSRASSAATTDTDESNNVVGIRDHSFTAVCTADRFYPAPRRFRATATTGEVSLSWSSAPSRFDLFRYVLRRASGATPPATPSDGTGITLSSNLATSVVDSGLASGTYSYSLWAQYDETSDALAGALSSPDVNSDRLTQAGLVVS